MTTRGYSLSATLREVGEAHVTDGQGRMEFIIGQVDGKWKIIRHIDQSIDEEGDK